jgi:serine/threonine protein kinase
MPAPATAAELLDLIQRSGVADEPKLRAAVQKFNQSSPSPNDPAKLAGVLVAEGVLTYFQAEQLLQGKYKRFTIGKYKVLEKLGAGGMAQVFLCEHKLMRRRVAIKVLPTAKAEDESSLQRFYREARAVAAVDHPNIVRAYDIDQDENLHFLVMEYVDGTNLQELVKKFGPLDVLRTCHYVYGASVGLQHAHEMGLVHRDVKPGNILIDRAGVVKILDMGLARFFHDDEDALTKKYDENVLGTADYLAPEQALDSHTVDIRADIYSLGATFYYLLTGSAPFPEGSVAQKLIWHQNRQPRQLKSLRPEVPNEIVAIVEKMMAKKPSARYQTPAEVMAALGSWVATPISPPADHEMPQLSLAAGGSGSGTSRGPATMIGGPLLAPPPGTGGGFAPTPEPARPPSAPGVGYSDPGSPNQLVWESLDTQDDTETVARGDTDRSTRPQPPARPRREPAAPTPPRTLLYVLVGLLAVATAVAVYFAVRDDRTPPPPPPDQNATGKWVVSKAPGANHVPTLRKALDQATPGDTIVVAEAGLSEPLLRLNPAKHRNLTIEGGTSDGTLPVIRPSGHVVAMFDIGSTEGVTLRNLEFDGQGRADVGVHMSGLCPGVVVENVTVRGTTGAGFRLLNAGGAAARPIVLDRVRTVASVATSVGVLMSAENVDTLAVRVRNSRFEGNGTAGVGVRVIGAASDLELSGNRFFNLDTAVSLGHVPKNKAIHGQVSANTVYQAKVGIAFDTTPLAPNEPGGTFRVTVNQNYFGKTLALATFTPPAAPVGVASANNGFGDGSAPGNAAIPATPLTAPVLPAPDPNDDATFLRFEKGPPEIAGKKVGAP